MGGECSHYCVTLAIPRQGWMDSQSLRVTRLHDQLFYLRVLDPPKITVHPVNSSVELVGKIKLYCNATEGPQPSFKWYKNGIAMVEASGVKPFQPELVMEDALPEDEARYYSEASNVTGKVRSNWASLKVFGE